MDAAPAPAERFVVETMRRSLVGEPLAIDPHEATLSVEGRSVTLPIDDLLSVRQEGRTASRSAEAVGRLTLRDGSTIPYTDWSLSGGRLRVGLATAAEEASPYELPLAEVSSWRLPAPDAADETAWSRIEPSAASDVLVVKTRAGDLRPIAGVIDRVEPDGVVFLLEEEPVDVPWERIAGLMFYREAPPARDRTIVVRGDHGLQINARRVAFQSPWLRLETTGGEPARLPIAMIGEIDFSDGKVFRASGLGVLAASRKPYFGPISEATDLSDAPRRGEGLPLRDAAFDGEPLSLRFPDPRAAGVWRDRPFDHGWALRSKSELVLRLPSDAAWLCGWVGLDPRMAATGSAEATLIADGEVLWAGTVDGQTPPVELRLPLAGAERLTLSVDYGENLDTGDAVHFAELRVLR